MRKLFIIALLHCICLSVFADTVAGKASLSGKVTDDIDKSPMVGVSIYFPELKEGTVTNENGDYSITDLPAVHTTIQVSYVGHQTIVRDVDLRTTHRMDFVMKEANAMIHEVVVTGLTGTELLRNSPSPVSIVSPRELQMSASTNIIDAVAKQPGVAQITTGSGISKPVIRGLGFNRILVVNDGIRQEGQQWGDEHGIEIDAQQVHSVEILKGPASLVYGSDAMAGVLIFHDEPVMAKGTMAGEVESEYQTNNGLFDYSADFAGNQGGLIWNWRWSQKMAHDYKNPYDGYVTNSRFQERALSGLLGVNRNWGYSHLKLSYYHLTPGIVEGERDEETGELERSGDIKSYGKLSPFQQIHHYKAVWDNSLLMGDGSLKLLVGYQQNRRQEFEEYDECGLDFKLHTLNYDIHYQSPEWNGWKNVVGINGMYQKSENLGEEFLIPSYNLFDIGVFATTCRSFGNWHVSGGLRYDTRHLHSHSLWTEEEGQRFTTFSRTFNGMTGSLGAICNITDQLDFRVNLSRGFRAPNMSELGSNGEHEGTLRYEIGNHQLDPEYSWQFDAGLDYSSAIVSAQLALFANHIDNYIFLERKEGVVIDDTPAFQYLSGDARIFGGEAILHIHPVEPLHFENTFSYVRSVQLHQSEESKYLPFTPAPRWLSTLRYDFIRDGKVLNNTYASIEMDCNLKQDHVHLAYDTETATPSYTLFNIYSGTDILHRGRKAASVFFFVNNLFDRAYQNHLSRLKYADTNEVTGRMGVYNMGRNIGVKLILPITF